MRETDLLKLSAMEAANNAPSVRASGDPLHDAMASAPATDAPAAAAVPGAPSGASQGGSATAAQAVRGDGAAAPAGAAHGDGAAHAGAGSLGPGSGALVPRTVSAPGEEDDDAGPDWSQEEAWREATDFIVQVHKQLPGELLHEAQRGLAMSALLVDTVTHSLDKVVDGCLGLRQHGEPAPPAPGARGADK